MSKLTANAPQLVQGENGRAVISVATRVQEVLVTLGYLPAGVLGAMMAVQANMLDNHRRSVISNAQQTWPGRGRARKFVAATTRFYPAKMRSPTELEHLHGESFAFTDVPKIMYNLQTGGVIRSTKGPMLIPFTGRNFGAGQTAHRVLLMRRQRGMYISALADGALLKPGHHGPTGDYSAGRVSISRTGVMRVSSGSLSVVVGALRMQRTQRPLLRFYELFEKNLPKHLKNYDEVFDAALTETGRTKLAAPDADSRYGKWNNLTRDQQLTTRRLSQQLRADTLASKGAVFDSTSRVVMTNTQRRMAGLMPGSRTTTKAVA